MNISKPNWLGFHALWLLGVCLFFLLQCQVSETAHQEKYISVKLNDSLKQFDKVVIIVHVAGDTNQVIGKIWDGPLPNPSSIPDYRLPEGETRKLSIQVKAYDKNGLVLLNTVIAKEGEKPVVTPLPLPLVSASLATLTLSKGVLVPGFNSEYLSYAVNLTYAESTLTLLATPVYAHAILSLGTMPLTSGVMSGPLALAVGEQTLSLLVKAGSQSATYTLKATRAARIPIPPILPPDTTIVTPSSLLLTSLKLETGILLPAFTSQQRNYLFTLASKESTFTVTAVPQSSGATMTLGSTPLISGSPSVPMLVPIGTGTFTLKVANGNLNEIYTLNTLRFPSGPGVVPKDTGFLNKTTFANYKSWPHAAQFTINIKSLNMEKIKVVAKFPILVRLNSSNFDFSQCQGHGEDIRMSNAAGVRLPVEISHWDSAAGFADVFVKLDTIPFSQDETKFYMYWGNSKATFGGGPEEVFAQVDGYSGVWHLSENATGSANDFVDATGKHNGRGGDGNGKNLPKQTEGVVGFGQDFFPGSVQGAITLPVDFDPGPNAWCMQVWLKRKGITNGAIFHKSNSAWLSSDQRFQLRLSGGYTNHIDLIREGNEQSTDIFIGGESFTNLAMSYDGTKVDFYVNGYFRVSKNWTQGTRAVCDVIVGASSFNGDQEGFTGSLDELWFSYIPHSSEWIRLSYENQKPGSTLVQFKPIP